jgi:hypothetical protein
MEEGPTAAGAVGDREKWGTRINATLTGPVGRTLAQFLYGPRPMLSWGRDFLLPLQPSNSGSFAYLGNISKKKH